MRKNVQQVTQSTIIRFICILELVHSFFQSSRCISKSQASLPYVLLFMLNLYPVRLSTQKGKPVFVLVLPVVQVHPPPGWLWLYKHVYGLAMNSESSRFADYFSPPCTIESSV
jgi:hypothetical protein